MPRPPTFALAYVIPLLAACGPEPVTGRPPPPPPGSPAVSSPGGRDAASDEGLDAGDASAASHDAHAGANDAAATSTDGHADAAADGTGTGRADASLDVVAEVPPSEHLEASADVKPESGPDAEGGAAVDAGTDLDATDGPTSPGAQAPAIGDLVIDEILANPTGSDLGREWIEIVNRSADPLDLSSLHVADTTTDVAVPAGTLAARALLVLGQSADPTKNGGAPVAAAYGTRLILNNEGEQVSICLGPCAMGVVLDTVAWGAIGAAYDGHALVIDPATKTICPATDPFGTAGDFGTPGAPNPPCSEADAGGTDALASNDGRASNDGPADRECETPVLVIDSAERR